MNHPRIFIPAEKELHFFTAHTDAPHEYARKFDKCSQGQIVSMAYLIIISIMIDRSSIDLSRHICIGR